MESLITLFNTLGRVPCWRAENTVGFFYLARGRHDSMDSSQSSCFQDEPGSPRMRAAQITRLLTKLAISDIDTRQMLAVIYGIS